MSSSLTLSQLLFFVFPGEMLNLMCSAGEISNYVASLVDLIGDSGEAAQPISTVNCNLTNWSQGCEDGWARAVQNLTSMSELYQNVETIPQRSGDPYSCCGGFFCPRGLSCMIRECSPYRSVYHESSTYMNAYVMY
jgi:hypothetical protein